MNFLFGRAGQIELANLTKQSGWNIPLKYDIFNENITCQSAKPAKPVAKPRWFPPLNQPVLTLFLVSPYHR